MRKFFEAMFALFIGACFVTCVVLAAVGAAEVAAKGIAYYQAQECLLNRESLASLYAYQQECGKPLSLDIVEPDKGNAYCAEDPPQQRPLIREQMSP